MIIENILIVKSKDGEREYNFKDLAERRIDGCTLGYRAKQVYFWVQL